MKPFDLKEAKEGKKVVTRDGKNVRIASFRNGDDTFPITAVVDIGTRDAVTEYPLNGSYFSSGKEHNLDLFMADDEVEQESSELQAWCKEILPVVQAAANGEEIEWLNDGEWERKDFHSFYNSHKYRIKPKLKMVNGFEVPMHETSALSDNTTYYTPDIHNKAFNTLYWWGDSDDHRFLASGIVYLDKESATKCAKAMLGINPEEE